jgi:hypothetical protein
MPADIRDYLMERFRSDAETLRARALMLDSAARNAPKAAGPDALLSRAMADACDDIAGLAQGLPEFAPLTDILRALRELLPTLRERTDSPVALGNPAVRSVYAGAATRVQEVIAAEERSAAAADGNVVGDDRDDFDADFDDAEDDDDDAFDDILEAHDDELDHNGPDHNGPAHDEHGGTQ